MEAISPALMVFLALMAVLMLSGRFAEVKREQARINQKLDLLLKHLGIENPMPAAVGYVPPDLLPQIKDLILARKKVNAIKLLREHTGHSLLDAKNTIEALERKI